MSKMLTEKDLKDLVLKEIGKLNDVKIYYECKRISTYLSRSTKYVKVCIALTNLGLPINAYTVSFIVNRGISTVISSLHSLGDKNILLLKRNRNKYFEWIIRPSFYEKVI